MTDLRDTFASQLLTCGVSLGYVSAQLGHSNVSTTARHYVRWAGGDTYRARCSSGTETWLPTSSLDSQASGLNLTPVDTAWCLTEATRKRKL